MLNFPITKEQHIEFLKRNLEILFMPGDTHLCPIARHLKEVTGAGAEVTFSFFETAEGLGRCDEWATDYQHLMVSREHCPEDSGDVGLYGEECLEILQSLES